MSNTAAIGFKWAEKGTQPMIKQKQRGRERITLFKSVNPISGEEIVQKANKGNTKTFKRYLKKILNTHKK